MLNCVKDEKTNIKENEKFITHFYEFYILLKYAVNE